jgi:hypothetical protein
MSREQYIRARTPCYGLHPWIAPLLWQFDQKMATAVHLPTNNSKIKVVSSLKKDCWGEGVSALNVAGEVKFLTPLCSALQSDKVREAKIADFWPFSRPARSQKTTYPSRSAYLSVPIQWSWPFVAVALSQFKVESHKHFPHCFVLTKTRRKQQKTGANLFGHNGQSTVPV